MLAVIVGSKCQAECLLCKVTVLSQEQWGNTTVYLAQLQERRFLIVETGYGKVNVGFGLGAACAHHKVTNLIGMGNCGVLGGIESQIGDIAVVTRALQYDVDFTPIGYNFNYIPGVKSSLFLANQELCKVAVQAARDENMIAITGLCVSADRFVADNVFRNQLKTRYEADFVDNESGCIGEEAFLIQKPFVVIKGISNCAGKIAGSQYAKYSKKADEYACRVVCRMVKCLLKEEEKKPEPCEEKCGIILKKHRELNRCECYEVIDSSKYVCLGMAEADQPYVIPMCFKERKEEGGCTIFLLISMNDGMKNQCLCANRKVALVFEERKDNCVKTVEVFGIAEIVKKSNDNCGEPTLIRVSEIVITGREYQRK